MENKERTRRAKEARGRGGGREEYNQVKGAEIWLAPRHSQEGRRFKQHAPCPSFDLPASTCIDGCFCKRASMSHQSSVEIPLLPLPFPP